MTGNYFTRPRGLHPTPAVCFPPPPAGPTGTITGTADVRFTPIQIGQNVGVDWQVTHTGLESGAPQTGVLNVPAMTVDGPVVVLNDLPGEQFITAVGPPGFYTGSLKVTFTTGQVRTFPFTYTIDP